MGRERAFSTRRNRVWQQMIWMIKKFPQPFKLLKILDLEIYHRNTYYSQKSICFGMCFIECYIFRMHLCQYFKIPRLPPNLLRCLKNATGSIRVPCGNPVPPLLGLRGRSESLNGPVMRTDK